MELINREELENRMYHEAFEVDSEMQKWESGCWIRYKLFEKVLDEMPTVENRTKGKWIMDRYCSSCEWNKEDFDYIGGWRENFCPNCGADMRGGKCINTI